MCSATNLSQSPLGFLSLQTHLIPHSLTTFKKCEQGLFLDTGHIAEREKIAITRTHTGHRKWKIQSMQCQSHTFWVIWKIPSPLIFLTRLFCENTKYFVFSKCKVEMTDKAPQRSFLCFASKLWYFLKNTVQNSIV